MVKSIRYGSYLIMLKRKILLTLALIIIFSGIIFYRELIFAIENMTTEELYQATLFFWNIYKPLITQRR